MKIKELLAYNHHSNLKWIEHLTTHEIDVPEVKKLMSHIINAHHIWNNRIIGSLPQFEVWQERSLSDNQSLNDQLHDETKSILDQYALEQSIEYQTTKGIIFSNSVQDILHHVVNHGTYHRGQISWLVSQSGNSAISTDYIKYKR